MGIISDYLTGLQRRQPPGVDRHAGRFGLPMGGTDEASPRTLAPGIDNQLDRAPGYLNDDQVRRDRFPFYERDRFTPPGDGWVNWTAAGPRRAELHMRNVSYRREAGSSASRFPVVEGSPTTGMHTMIAPGTGTVERYYQTPQIRPGRQDRLAAGQYSGQTYSQTTRPQGGIR